MKRFVLVSAVAVCICSAQTYQPNWESLDRRPAPSWYTDAKFGIFIHWGVYAVPSFAKVGQYSEWYWNTLQKGRRDKDQPNQTWEFHNRVYGPSFPYQNFAPLFRAELFDPAQWADVFKSSGAKYVVLTSKHHDGFALWPSKEADKTWGRPWNSVSTGPKRDLLGDLTSAVRKNGLRMGFYYSLYEWYNPLWLADKNRFVSEHMFPQFKDVVTRYQPSIIFSDGEWEMESAAWRSPELLAWLYNESPVKKEVIVNDRWGKETRHKHGGYFTTEYTAGLENSAKPWEENRGIGYSFGYNRMEQLKDYRTDRELLLMLVDLVSRGGNLLLDIGPTADGSIPVIMQERLRGLGQWLEVNGEAIYGTTSWNRHTRQFSAGKIPELKSGQFMVKYDVLDYVDRKDAGQAVIEAFFTAKNRDLYAIVPASQNRSVTLRDVSADDVQLLGAGPVKAVRSGNDLVLELPAAYQSKTNNRYAYVYKLKGAAR